MSAPAAAAARSGPMPERTRQASALPVLKRKAEKRSIFSVAYPATRLSRGAHSSGMAATRPIRMVVLPFEMRISWKIAEFDRTGNDEAAHGQTAASAAHPERSVPCLFFRFDSDIQVSVLSETVRSGSQ